MFLKYEKFWILKHIWPQGFCIRIVACETDSDAIQRRHRDVHSHAEIYPALPGTSSWCQVHGKSSGIWRWMYSGWVKEHVLGIFFPKLVLILQCVSEFPWGASENAHSDLVSLECAWALALLSVSGWGLCGWDFSRLWVGLRPGARWPHVVPHRGSCPCACGVGSHSALVTGPNLPRHRLYCLLRCPFPAFCCLFLPTWFMPPSTSTPDLGCAPPHLMTLHSPSFNRLLRQGAFPADWPHFPSMN